MGRVRRTRPIFSGPLAFLAQVLTLLYLLSCACDLIDLNKIAAGIVENGYACHTHISWLHRKFHPQLFKAIIFLLNIINLEGRIRDPVLNERGFKRFHGRVISIRL